MSDIFIDMKTDLYRKCGKSSLCKSGFLVDTNTTITVGDKETLWYDHERQDAFPVKGIDEDLYILKRDLDRVEREFLEDKVEGRA